METYKRTLVQSLLIFLSVFLGLWAGNWNEERKEKKRARIFLKNLQKELQNNRDKVEKSAPYHEHLGRTVDSLFEHSNKEFLESTLFSNGGFDKIPGWSGMHISPMETAVYESGIVSSSFEHLPIELMIWISKMYSFQDEYDKFSHSLSDKLLNVGSETKMMDVLVPIAILGSDIGSMEKQMAKSYDRTIASIEAELKKR